MYTNVLTGSIKYARNLKNLDLYKFNVNIMLKKQTLPHKRRFLDINFGKGYLKMKKIIFISAIFCFFSLTFTASAAESLFEKDADWWKKADTDKIENLIKYDANIYERTDRDETTLMWAAKYDNLALVKTFIKYGVEVRATNKDGVTALMFAAEYASDPQIIDALVMRGADVAKKDKKGLTPLMFAAQKNPHPEIIRRLIKFGSNINEKSNSGSTPIMLAAGTNSNPEIIETLLEMGVDFADADNSGKNAFMYAAENNSNPKILFALISANYKLSPKLQNLPYPLLVAALKNKIKLESKDILGRTALMLAAAHNPSERVVKALLELGANIDAKDGAGRTALEHALANNLNIDTVFVLLNHKPPFAFIRKDGQIKQLHYLTNLFDSQDPLVFDDIQSN